MIPYGLAILLMLPLVGITWRTKQRPIPPGAWRRLGLCFVVLFAIPTILRPHPEAIAARVGVICLMLMVGIGLAIWHRYRTKAGA